MSKIFVGSDFHWGHKNIMNFCAESRARYNNDLDYMNSQMIVEWNDLVAPEDTVYMLGDIAFLPATKAAEIVSRLNGTKILIAGNHDVKTLKDYSFRKQFASIHDYLEIVHDGHRIVMAHFPFLEWNAMHRGSLHFFGHLHGGHHGHEKYRCMDVGMDATGSILIPIESAIDAIKNNEIKHHH